MSLANDKNPQGSQAGSRGLTLALLAGLVLSAIPARANDADEGGFRLFVRPSICVSYDSDAPCTMEMEVSWEGSTPADVCLREALATPLLRCWENSRSGSVALSYEHAGDVLYQLVEEGSLGVLAETEIKVINRDLRSSRKRRRHVWSIL